MFQELTGLVIRKAGVRGMPRGRSIRSTDSPAVKKGEKRVHRLLGTRFNGPLRSIVVIGLWWKRSGSTFCSRLLSSACSLVSRTSAFCRPPGLRAARRVLHYSLSGSLTRPSLIVSIYIEIDSSLEECAMQRRLMNDIDVKVTVIKLFSNWKVCFFWYECYLSVKSLIIKIIVETLH